MLIGAREMWNAKGGGDTPAYWGLCFTAEEPDVVVNMSKTGSPPAVTLETSTDGVTWTAFDAAGGTTPITLAAVGDKVYFRAGSGGNTGFASSARAYRKFTISGLCSSSGNIMSLLDGTNPTNVAFQANYSFVGLFYGCTGLTTAPMLPATTLSSSCYRLMFYGCTSLTAAPMLPATTLADACYVSMFSGCTGLTTAPSLPATTLAGNCYSSMFHGCTLLTTAPTLPVTTLQVRCYEQMFYGCTSLTAAPELPATTLADACYNLMFYGCTSLTAAPMLPATTLSSSCYYGMFRGCTSLTAVEVKFAAFSPTNATTNWLYEVAASGTFRCPTALGTGANIMRGGNYCPAGWTVINTDA